MKDDIKFELSGQKLNSIQNDEKPNFKSLKPYSMVASEQLSETVLSINASDAELNA